MTHKELICYIMKEFGLDHFFVASGDRILFIPKNRENRSLYHTKSIAIYTDQYQFKGVESSNINGGKRKPGDVVFCDFHGKALYIKNLSDPDCFDPIKEFFDDA